jgi:predicted transcriptional regulator
MDEHLKEALGIVRAQAGHRAMTEEEITSMVKKLSASIQAICEGGDSAIATEPATDPKKAIKEKSVTCLVCGKVFKLITKRHLATHGLTPEEYLEKFGYKKGTALVSRALQKARKRKMQEMKLWERRGVATGKTKKK